MLGVPGLYLPSDPGAVSAEAKQGMLLVAVGSFFEKGLRMGMGQANARAAGGVRSGGTDTSQCLFP